MSLGEDTDTRGGSERDACDELHYWYDRSLPGVAANRLTTRCRAVGVARGP
jgi:hypothetical protein